MPLTQEHSETSKQKDAYSYISRIINAIRAYDNIKGEPGLKGFVQSPLTNLVSLVRDALAAAAQTKLYHDFYQEFHPELDYDKLAKKVYDHLQRLPQIQEPAGSGFLSVPSVSNQHKRDYDLYTAVNIANNDYKQALDKENKPHG